MERYAAAGQGWVVHRHAITYKRPAVAGDVLLAATWVAEYASRQCLRRYAFLRQADGAVLAEAETAWMYIDMTTGRAIRVPDALRHDFAVVTDEEEVRAFLRALWPSRGRTDYAFLRGKKPLLLAAKRVLPPQTPPSSPKPLLG